MPLYVHEWDFFNDPIEKSHEVILIEDHAKVIAAKDVEIEKLQENVRVLTEALACWRRRRGMKFHTQEFRHDPSNGSYGDCQRAVIASLLGLEMSEVPNFNEGGPDGYEFFERLKNFLVRHNLGMLSIPFDGSDIDIVTQHMLLHYTEGQPYTVSGQSTRGVNHAVIYRGADLLWDPYPDGKGLVGPCTDGYYWVEVITQLLDAKRPAKSGKDGVE